MKYPHELKQESVYLIFVVHERQFALISYEDRSILYLGFALTRQ